MSGAVWGQAADRGAPFHRVTSLAFGEQVVACGDTVAISGTYHCVDEAGEPAIGKVCEWCQARMVREYKPGDRVQIVDDEDTARGVVIGTEKLRYTVKWDDGVQSVHVGKWLRRLP